METQKNYICIDDSAYIHRYFFAYQKINKKTMGSFHGKEIEVTALEGLLDYTNKLKENFPNSEIIHILDPDNGSAYRKSIYPEYKKRPEKDEILRLQLDILPYVLDGYDQRFIKVDGVEADDILTKISMTYGKKDYIILAAEDKDVWYNVADPGTRENVDGIVCVCRYRKNDKGYNVCDLVFSDYVLEKFGVLPHLMPDYLALLGDTADNIPGVKGIGQKGAAKLLSTYGNIINIMEAAEAGEIKGAVQKNILAGKDDLILSKKLTMPFLDFELPELDSVQPSNNYETQSIVKKIVRPNEKWVF